MNARKTTYSDGADIVAITAPPSPHPTDPTEEDQHQFIVDHWTSLAAASFEGFQRYGTGAVVVAERTSRTPGLPHPFAAHQVSYATSFSAWLQNALRQDAAAWLEEQFERYDPHSSCMFIFLRQDEVPRPYLAEGTLKPPQALSRIQALLN